MTYFLPFFAFGMVYKYWLENIVKKIQTRFIVLITFSIQLVISFVCNGRMPSYSAAFCNDFVDGPLLPLIIGINGIILWLRLSELIVKCVDMKFIRMIADNTCSIMTHHIMGFMLVKFLFAFLNANFGLCVDFDWEAFKSNIWYYYMPKENSYFGLVYVITGVSFSLMMQQIINVLKNHNPLKYKISV